MKVMKFGGTSVGSVKSILKVKEIVESVEKPVIIVVSALGGVTDQLLQTSALAAQGDYTYEKEYNQLMLRHIEIVEGVIEDSEKRNGLLKEVTALLGELENILRGVFLVKDLSQKTSDIIVRKNMLFKEERKMDVSKVGSYGQTAYETKVNGAKTDAAEETQAKKTEEKAVSYEKSSATKTGKTDYDTINRLKKDLESRQAQLKLV